MRDKQHQIESLAVKCRKIIDCDTARISQTSNTMFLVIGFNRNTKDDEGQWIKNGEPYDFDYVEEKVVASGETKEELLASVLEYKRLCGMTMKEYLFEIITDKTNTEDRQ